jgi:hypothetical protein
MSSVMAVEHAATSLLGIVVLGMIAWGSVTYGFLAMFRAPIGHRANRLAVVTVIGLLWD